MSDSVQPLKDAASEFLAAQFKDIGRFQEEVLNLPLVGIEAVLSSDDLQVATEYDVYDIVLKWARKHYPEMQERREVLKTRLLRLIRFPLMISGYLKKSLLAMTLSRISFKNCSRVSIFQGQSFSSTALSCSRAGQLYNTCHYFVERAYKFRPIQVVEFELPHQQSIVYFDLKKEECLRLFPSGQVTRSFSLGQATNLLDWPMHHPRPTLLCSFFRAVFVHRRAKDQLPVLLSMSLHQEQSPLRIL
ncbi:UNVERIFIED_CONTAM: BTB/POZ domain-containing protein [Sesamum radiatum]|uniref:BTB/POZ domain-containing protein n=1 Tax=Sesamum radiatum TaxID=300843 RepID=A0AAW2L3F1_SESRA